LIDIQFSADSKYLVSASADRSIRVWDLSTSRVLSVLQGTELHAEHVAVSADGRLVVFSGEGETRVWDVRNGSESRVVHISESDPISELVFEPDGTSFATVSGGRVTVRDAATGESRSAPDVEGPLCLAYRPEGRLIVNDAKQVVFFNNRGARGHVLEGAQQWGSALEFAPEGRVIACAGSDRTITLRETSSGQVLRTLRGQSADVTALGFSPDGRRIASGGSDGTVFIWEVASDDSPKTLHGGTQPVRCLMFHPNGRDLVAAGSQDEGGFVLQLGQSKEPGELKVWDTERGVLRFSLNGHAAGVSSACYSPDGRRIVSADGDGALKLWDAFTGRELLTLRGASFDVRRVAFSPDGRRIASAGGAANLIRAQSIGEIVIWDGRPLK
jgi:WD40 repeat protein